MRYEISIEVMDGAFPAGRWADAYGDVLTSSALSRRATDWRCHGHSWGVVLELAFADEEDYYAFRDLPAVRAALDAVPGGVVVKRGWGGTSGTWEPRGPRPACGSGAESLPIPITEDAPGALADAPPPVRLPGKHATVRV